MVLWTPAVTNQNQSSRLLDTPRGRTFPVNKLVVVPGVRKCPGLILPILSVRSLHVLIKPELALSRFSSFIPQTKEMHTRLTCDCIMSVGVNVSVCKVVCLHMVASSQMGYSCYRDSCASDLSRVPYVSWLCLQPFWTWVDKQYRQLVDRRSPSWVTKYAVCPSFLEQHRHLRISLYLSKLIHLYCKALIVLAIFINNRSPSEPTKSTCGYWVLLTMQRFRLQGCVFLQNLKKRA